MVAKVCLPVLADTFFFISNMDAISLICLLTVSYTHLIRVNAVADNLTHAIRSTVPESIKMTLHFVDSDVRYTGSLSEDEIGNPRIHTEQFTPQFN